ncbi:MAG: rhomboid family intramembrane serine protease [Bacteroidetes bacterium]|nr:MAG: rhomboid family intramembrane serine protease [Bacteroidota bacterium]
MFSFFSHMPSVTKNLLIINVLLYFVSIWFESTGVINLFDLFSSHYIGTPFFEPFQIVTHMFMHSAHDFRHIFFNMFGLVIFGSHLEQVWGAKKFFIFYFIVGIGAFAVENIYYGIQVYQLKNELVAMGYDLSKINDFIMEYKYFAGSEGIASPDPNLVPYHLPEGIGYIKLSLSSGLGASGALFGILGAFVILFPNTELMLLFIPYPIKAKYLIGIYILYEVYRTFNPVIGDNVNHLAHISGAAIGIAYVFISRKFDRGSFY